MWIFISLFLFRRCSADFSCVFFVKFCIKQFCKYFQRCHTHVFNQPPSTTGPGHNSHAQNAQSTFCHSLSQSPSFLFATWNQRSEVAYECHRISVTLPNVLIRSGNERVHDNNCPGKGNLRLHYGWGRHIMTTKATNNMRNGRLTEPSSRNLAK